jgi:hypothetical protein
MVKEITGTGDWIGFVKIETYRITNNSIYTLGVIF